MTWRQLTVKLNVMYWGITVHFGADMQKCTPMEKEAVWNQVASS